MLINNKSLIKTINKLNLTDDEREKFNKISEDDNGNFLYNGKSVTSGATTEQAAQIQANKTAIGDENSGLIKEVNNIKNTELQNLNTAIQTLETLVGVDETVGDKTGLPSGDANVIASINRIDAKSVNSVLKNKKGLFIGDSLTLKTYHSEKNYHDFISEKKGCTVINWGKDGYTYVQMLEQIASMPSNEEVDFITVFLGTNDWHVGTLELGTFGDKTTTTVSGNIYNFYDQLITKYGDKPIYVFTPLPRNNAGVQWGLNCVANNRNYNLLQLVDVIKQTCEHFSIPCMDLYRESGFFLGYNISKSKFFTDGLHLNIKGHEVLGNKMIPFLENNYQVYSETVVENIPVQSIELNSYSETLNIGDNFTISPTIIPSNATNTSVTFSSNAPDIADVATNGVVTAKSTGEAIITVTTEDGNYSKNCTITVTNSTIALQGISFEKSSANLYVGRSETLNIIYTPDNATNKEVTWSSDHPEIAKVENGVVTGMSVGEAIITATSQENSSYVATCTYTVTEEVIDGTNLFTNPDAITLSSAGTSTINEINSTSFNCSTSTRWSGFLITLGSAIDYTKKINFEFDYTQVRGECPITINTVGFSNNGYYIPNSFTFENGKGRGTIFNFSGDLGAGDGVGFHISNGTLLDSSYDIKNFRIYLTD